MKIIDKAKGFYEDHKQQFIAVALGAAGGAAVLAFVYAGVAAGVGMANNAILSEIARNPGMLLTDFAKKYDL